MRGGNLRRLGHAYIAVTDQLPPLGGFFGLQAIERRGVASDRQETSLCQALPLGRAVEEPLGGLAQFGQHRCGGGGRRDQAPVSARLKAGDRCFRYGRYVWE